MAEKQKCPECGTELPDEATGPCLGCALKFAMEAGEKGGQEIAAPGAPATQAHTQPDAPTTPGSPRTIRIAPVESENPGDILGRYKLLEKIGEGGFGTVYVAEQREPVKRRVALKIIKLGMDTKEVVARFEVERQALAMMDHPNIAKVLDAGALENGRPYFAMELVRGIKITEYCDQNKLSTRERLDLFVKICHAVQHAHQKGIIHRDIKPSNILVTLHDGVPVPKVIDFGIAKATIGELTDKTVYTQLQQFIGTPAYMSPEQAEMSGLDIDTRSDIYSLGVLLYELLTGKTPFEAKDLLKAGLDEMRRIIREQEPSRPSTRLSMMAQGELSTTAGRRQSDSPKLLHLVRGDLDWIVMKCLEKDRTRRYEAANGLAQDIGRHLASEPVLACPPSAAYRLQKAWQRNRPAFASAALIAAILLAATGISAWQAVRATRAEALAKQRLAESEANASLAKQRLADSEAISTFLTEVFQSPNPARDGRTITVAETLGAAAKKLDTDLASQPNRRAKLQATVAGTYGALGLYTNAIPLQEKARDYYLATFGPERTETLQAMLNLASFYHEAGRRDEALKLREQVLALSRKVNGAEGTNTITAMHNLAISYDDAGRWDEALKLREQVLAFQRKVLGPEDPSTLSAMGNLALSYDDVGRRDEALKLREQELALSRKVNGPENPDTIMAIGNLAKSYDDVGRRDEALKLREQELALSRKVNGPEHPNTLTVMNNLAYSYDGAGRRDETLKLREQMLALARKVSGPEHPDTIKAMNNLAISYGEAGRRDDALKLREQVRALQRKVLGPEHPDTLTAMNNLAFSYDEAGRRDEALKLREEVLALSRKVKGPEHPDTILAMDNLATSYHQAGRRDEALKLREQVLALRRKVLGPEHSGTLLAMNNLAFSYDEAGRRDEALRLREQVLALQPKVLGPEHPDTLTAMDNLAFSYDEAGRRGEALKLREQELALSRKVLGLERSGTLLAMNHLSISYENAGRRQEALKLQEEVLALSRKLNGAEHPDTLMAMKNLAVSYNFVGRRQEARKLSEEAAACDVKMKEEGLALSRKLNGPDHPDTLKAMEDLGISYYDAGRREEAVKLEEEALALHRKVLGPENPETLAAMRTLAGGYAASGHPDDALKLREELLALNRKVYGPEHRETLASIYFLAGSYASAGRREEALKMREELLALTRKVSGPEDPVTLLAMYNLATSYPSAGRREEALKLWEELLVLRRKVNGPEHPATIDTMIALAYSYFEAGRTGEGFLLLEKARDAGMNVLHGSFALAASQAWFGHVADYEETRRSLLQKAQATDQAKIAYIAANSASLRPSTNLALLANALKLAQRAVDLGKNDESLPWYRLGLGLSQYRNGQYAAAERTLAVAEEAVSPAHDVIQGTSGLIRSMSLFQQGRQEEAGKLFSLAEAQMPPLPADESKPHPSARSLDHTVLVWWMIYKEAKATLHEPAVPRAGKNSSAK